MHPARSPSAAFLLALGALAALGHALLALTAAASKSMTADEIAHLTAGHAYNTRGDFRLQPENGNLPQRWAALPLLAMGAELPPVDSPAWRRADVWNYGHQFFFRHGLSADFALFAGRAMIALFSAATGLLVFLWSRALFGWRGAFLSLALFALCPAFLAHGALATSDVVMTFFFLASVGAWWRHLEDPGAGRAVLSAVVFGFACVSKFSAVLLAPMFALCALVSLAGRTAREGWRRPALRLLRSAALHLVAAGLVVWIFYGCRFRAFAPAVAEGAGFYRGDWNWILEDFGWSKPLVVALRDWQALPEAFLYGFAFVVQFARERSAFLNGEYSTTGWVHFFPFAFLVKSTLPFLLACAVGATAVSLRLARAARTDRLRSLLRRLRPLTPLAALFAVAWATSLASHLNIGHRHILPTYPVLFIAAGWLARWLNLRRPLACAGLSVLLLWHALESGRIRPHYLAYFNQLVGGPSQGWRHFVDSSLDWGQDLPGLRAWLDAHARGEKVFLSYFGTGDPLHEGIAATALPTLPEVGPPR
ncbi:MAG: glycosyltransferase family 39 protein, partial [Verrucomicrobia bacterium]|nr:glycosyltransferase family 39 protein [Verrucomicrobiota bacterium]